MTLPWFRGYNISIHAPREGGDGATGALDANQRISIHAPREGGDWFFMGLPPLQARISIHAPREGGDCCRL